MPGVKDLMRVVNTRLMLFDKPTGVYYLHVLNQWLVARSPVGEWSAAIRVPPSYEQVLAAPFKAGTVDPLDPQPADDDGPPAPGAPAARQGRGGVARRTVTAGSRAAAAHPRPQPRPQRRTRHAHPGTRSPACARPSRPLSSASRRRS